MEIMLIIYLVLAYWATGKTVYRNRILIGDGNSIFIRKVMVGFFFGFVLIPVAVIRLLLDK